MRQVTERFDCVKLGFLCIIVNVLFFFAVMGTAFANTTDDADPNYDAKGLTPEREYSSLIPNETIDPFTGNLMLTLTPISFPINGGRTFKLNLVYNSKIFKDQGFTRLAEDSPVGVGWTLHMGRLVNPDSTNITVEMPDGSSHPCYTSGVYTTGPWFTRENWLLTKSGTTYTLTTTDGMKYVFAPLSSPVVCGTDIDKKFYYPCSSITDTHSNTITMGYTTPTTTMVGTQAFLRTITIPGGPANRTITLNYSTINTTSPITLNSIQASDRTYTFFYDKYIKNASNVNQFKILSRMQCDAVGLLWKFSYYTDTNPMLLKDFVTPNGAKFTYDYTTQSFSDASISNNKVYYQVVSTKTLSGDCTGGTWTYKYETGNKTTIDHPKLVNQTVNKREIYNFWGYNTGNFWRTGLLASKQIGTWNGSTFTCAQQENYTWTSLVITTDSNAANRTHADSTIYQPILQKKEIIRSGKTYTTTYGNFDTYGHPQQIVETGQGTRTTTLGYWYNTTLRIIDDRHILTQTIKVGNNNSYTNSYTYYDNGKLHEQTLSGVKTTYTYDTQGNLYQVTNARNITTSYSSYYYGQPRTITKPRYVITQGVNYWGKITSWQDGRNQPTSYGYDGLSRLKTVTPPVGAPTTYTYAPHGAYVLKAIGTNKYKLYTYYDALGRNTGTYETVSKACKDITYDALGRKKFESYAYQGTKSTTDRNLPTVSQGDFYPVGATQLATPTNLTATPHRTDVVLSWSAVAGANTYTVRNCDPRGNPNCTGGMSTSTTSLTWPSLTPGTQYTFCVQAADNTNARPPSTWSCVQPTTITGIANPSFEASGSGYDYIDLTWKRSANTGVVYELWRANDPQGCTPHGAVTPCNIKNVSAVTLPYRFTGLSANTPYTFYLRVQDQYQSSIYKDYSVTASTAAYTSLDFRITSVTQSGSTYTATFAWNPVASCEGGRYVLCATPGTNVCWNDCGSTNACGGQPVDCSGAATIRNLTTGQYEFVLAVYENRVNGPLIMRQSFSRNIP